MKLLLLEACINFSTSQSGDGVGTGRYLGSPHGGGYGIPYYPVDGDGYGVGEASGRGSGDLVWCSRSGNTETYTKL